MSEVPGGVQEKWSLSTLKCPVAIPLAAPFNLASSAAALHLLLSAQTFRPNLSGTFNAMSTAQQEDNARLVARGAPQGGGLYGIWTGAGKRALSIDEHQSHHLSGGVTSYATGTRARFILVLFTAFYGISLDCCTERCNGL